MSNIERVSSIIGKSTKKPTIINKNSKFVVVTYWWGRGNLNANTARPCISYYEEMIQKGINSVIKSVGVIYKQKKTDLHSLILKYIEKIEKIYKPYINFLNKAANVYIDMLYELCRIKKVDNSENKLMKRIEEMQKEGAISESFVYKSHNEIKLLFNVLTKEIIRMNIDRIAALILLENDVIELKEKFTKKNKVDEIKTEINEKILQKRKIKGEISASLKEKRDMSHLHFGMGMNIFDILNDKLRFLSPIKFEEMIHNWEMECSEKKCNYLAIEYPEFAERGGYQLAINAKPNFIKKAIELCYPRAVLYIDGDMFIRKYPILFDIEDVDFMARGWWVDPRGSDFNKSVSYDPYMFETSGGIMYFSQSSNSKFLVDKWIEVAKMKSQSGKADDRVLSLVFNTFKLLLKLKIIQLPIEYLWLTLRYDEPILELYDYNIPKLKNSIIIEHPECLTSEETAADAGASSDRTPKYYTFIGEDYIVPVSEEVHEYLMFPNKEMRSAFDDYYEFMNSTPYFNDGNEYLIQKKLVNLENPELNEYPLYIIPYDKKLGDKTVYKNENGSYSYNDISELNFKRSHNIVKKMKKMPFVKKHGNIIEITRNDQYNLKDSELISLIIGLENKTVIYNPINKNGYDVKYYNKLIQNIDTLYKDLEIVFVPQIKNNIFSDFFKPSIDLSQVMLFRCNNRICKEFLSMFLSMEELSDRLSEGSYEFMSRVSVGYIKKDNIRVKPELHNAIRSMHSQGGNQINFMSEYEYSLEQMSKYEKSKKINKSHKSHKSYNSYKTRKQKSHL